MPNDLHGVPPPPRSVGKATALLLEFQLPKASYATVAVREVMKRACVCVCVTWVGEGYGMFFNVFQAGDVAGMEFFGELLCIDVFLMFGPILSWFEG